MRKVTLVLLMCFQLICLIAQDINKEYGLVKIGCEPDYPPFCFVDENGNPDGFSIDLFHATADAVDLEYDIKIDLWNRIKQDLAEGKLDALPLVGRTPEREPFFDFTFPYSSLHGAVFIRNNDWSVKTLEDLKSKEVIVMKGDNAEEYIRRDSICDHIILADTFEEAFELLASGMHDAVITQRIMGLQLLKNLKIHNITPLDIILINFRQDFCFAVTEGNKELLEKLNEGLATVISDGTYDKLHQKWFTPIMETSLSAKEKFFLALKIIIPSIFVIALILIFFMQKEIKRKTKALKDNLAEIQISHKLLRESEKKFRSYIDSSPVGIFVTDEKGYYVDVNNAATNITGYSREELLKMQVTDFSVKNDRSTDSNFRKLLAEHSFSVEKPFVTKNGETKFWRIDAVKLEENRYLGFTTDTTEKWETSKKLKESNQMLQQLFNNMNSAFAYHKIILENDKPVDYVFLKVNSSFERMLALTQKEIIGKRVTHILPDIVNDPVNWISKYGNVALSQKPARFESYSPALNRWYFVNAYSPHKGYFATIFYDITQRKKNEKELEQYRNELEHKVNERTRELEEMNKELMGYNKLFVGREFRIKELRDKISILEERLKKYEKGYEH